MSADVDMIPLLLLGATGAFAAGLLLGVHLGDTRRRYLDEVSGRWRSGLEGQHLPRWDGEPSELDGPARPIAGPHR